MKHDHSAVGEASRQRKMSRYVFIAFAAIAAYFLIMEHRDHLFVILPFLLLAACPLLHFFHHRGRNHGGEDSRPASGPQSQPSSSPGGGAHRH